MVAYFTIISSDLYSSYITSILAVSISCPRWMVLQYLMNSWIPVSTVKGDQQIICVYYLVGKEYYRALLFLSSWLNFPHFLTFWKQEKYVLQSWLTVHLKSYLMWKISCGVIIVLFAFSTSTQGFAFCPQKFDYLWFNDLWFYLSFFLKKRENSLNGNNAKFLD